MSQYKTGTATVTNGSATVTGSGTLWLANVTAGDSFTVAGDGVMYDVASVDSDTQVTLSVAYAGVTASGVVYAIGTGFTVPDSFPEMSQGDIETATIFTRGMRKIQSRFTGIAINTTAEIGQAVSDHVALPDPHSQYAELSGGASANFTAMPQVGGDPIVESGSNADGEWTRWADGTQICTGTYTTLINDSADSDIGGLFRTSFTDVVDLPISFIDTDYFTFCQRTGGDSGFDYQGSADSTSNFRFISIRGTSGTVSAGVSFQFHAIGRWQ